LFFDFNSMMSQSITDETTVIFSMVPPDLCFHKTRLHHGVVVAYEKPSTRGCDGI
jgi:hypothetical protein